MRGPTCGLKSPLLSCRSRVGRAIVEWLPKVVKYSGLQLCFSTSSWQRNLVEHRLQLTYSKFEDVCFRVAVHSNGNPYLKLVILTVDSWSQNPSSAMLQTQKSNFNLLNGIQIPKTSRLRSSDVHITATFTTEQ